MSQYEGVKTANTICNLIQSHQTIRTNKKIEYFNCAISFDIESTSFVYTYGQGEPVKSSTMYIWMFAVEDYAIYGRTWAEFEELMEIIQDVLGLSDERRIIIYVHNLSFEFQFICNRFQWSKVFALDAHKPLTCVTGGLEFRCSYLLSGLSLEKVGQNLTRHKVKKKTGDLDYTKIRHSKTPLTQEELGYCLNDVLVVTAYIRECIENDGDITRIPLTVTGYVRNYCRKLCIYKGRSRYKNTSYIDLMKSLQIQGEEEYKQLRRAFQGGFTHANSYYVGRTLENVKSYDFTSSYPYVMISEYFPMGKSEIVHPQTIEEIERYCKLYCCLFDIEFKNLIASKHYEHYLSSSRCYTEGEVITDNGRIAKAESLKTTVTELDYDIIKRFYKWDEMRIANFRIYTKGYLPTELVKAVLKLYGDKTELKGVKGKEEEYMRGKGMLNSTFGMMVTNISREIINYCNGEWTVEKGNIEEDLKSYNNSMRRFLYYPWGVWVTAYARHNLFTAIQEFGFDYIYSDTDSVKVFNWNKHEEYIKNYEKTVILKLRKAMEIHGLDFALCEPKTIKGDKKLIGVWSDEGVYKRFKTLGAKRYMTDDGKEILLTVSGLNKYLATPYLVKKYGEENCFEGFKNGMLIPPDCTGKLTHTYIDIPQDGILTDYLGNTAEFHEHGGVNLSPQDYTLSLSKMFIDFLRGYKDE